jgi:putative peptidoglycan lipid II flippase
VTAGAVTGAAADADSARRLVRSSAVVGLGTGLSRVTGFLRVAAIAYALGGATLAGTYSYANETPNIVYELLLGGILTATLVPIFVRHVEERDDDAINAVITVAMTVLTAVTLVGIVLAPWIVRLYTLRVTGGDRTAQQQLATALLRLFLPQMVFYCFTAMASALLNAHRRFAAAAFCSIANNVVVIALFVTLPRVTGPLTFDRVRHDTPLVLALGLGTTAGIAAMALVLVPALRHAGVRLRFLLDWRHAAVATMLRLSGWTIGYVVANQIALWLVLVLANGERGGPFLYLAAYAFFVLPHGLFAVSLMTTTAPELAAAAARNDLVALRDRLSLGLRLTVTVVVPAAALYIGLARPIVVALLQHGRFTGGAAGTVADTLVGFSVGLVGFSVYLFALRAYYSLHDTRTPFVLNAFENAVNVVLALVLFAWLGIPGLALAFSGAYAVAALVTLAALRRRLGGIDGRRLLGTSARLLVVGLAVAATTWAVSRWLGWSGAGRAVLTTAVGSLAALAVAVGGLAVLRVPELEVLRALLPGRRAKAAEANERGE